MLDGCCQYYRKVFLACKVTVQIRDDELQQEGEQTNDGPKFQAAVSSILPCSRNNRRFPTETIRRKQQDRLFLTETNRCKLSLSLSLSLSACMCRGEAVTETIQFSNFAEIKLEGPKQIDILARRALPASASFQISLSCLFPTKWHTCTQQQDRMNQLTNYKCILWLTR